MVHVQIMEATKRWPPHWQKCFEEMSIVYGKARAFEMIVKMKGGEN